MEKSALVSPSSGNMCQWQQRTQLPSSGSFRTVSLQCISSVYNSSIMTCSLY